MNKKLQTAKYVIADWLSATIAWAVFVFLRKKNEVPWESDIFHILFSDPKFFVSIVFIPLCWLVLYAGSGAYYQVYRKGRMRELGQTLLVTIIGVVVIFFAFILDDDVIDYRNYYKLASRLFLIHFLFTFTFRFILTSRTLNRIRNKKIGFNTIIVGSNGNAISIYNEIESQSKSSGNRFVGFVHAVQYPSYKLEKFIPNLGHFSGLKKHIETCAIEEVIIATERSEHGTIEKIISEIEDTDVRIKVIPDMQDFLLGTIRTTSIYSAPLIQISFDYMPQWQQTIKRVMDIFLSLFAMIILSPVYLACAIGVKLSSKGPVFYRQERIGLRGKPFMIPKFRSMYIDAEKHCPMLSSATDPRVTPFGRIMRKYRLDEIPQFFTVLRGEMSLVGPRPERQYFIDQIMEQAPHYRLLLKVKPGITSWGQVKYGYAESIQQMIERLKFDILYLDNISLAMDIKILAYTLLTVIKGSGK